MVIQTTKQGPTFAFNRETGEPVSPIEEHPVPQSIVPGEQMASTQPIPTKPEPLNPLGLSEDDLIDFTPELREEALELMSQYRIGGPYMPPLPNNHSESVKAWIACSGGLNITHPAVLDPEPESCTSHRDQAAQVGCCSPVAMWTKAFTVARRTRVTGRRQARPCRTGSKAIAWHGAVPRGSRFTSRLTARSPRST